MKRIGNIELFKIKKNELKNCSLLNEHDRNVLESWMKTQKRDWAYFSFLKEKSKVMIFDYTIGITYESEFDNI